MQLAEFSARFGELEINVANAYQEPGLPQVMILSNIVENGKPIGLADAGQGWHTDMSYSRMIAFANVLYGIQIPHRNGVAAGWQPSSATCVPPTTICPDELKRRLDGHDRAARLQQVLGDDATGEGQPAPAADRSAAQGQTARCRIRCSSPIRSAGASCSTPTPATRCASTSFPSGKATRRSQFLFAHQLQDKYRYVHRWQTGDVLMWDDLSTIHQAVADYGPDEHRLIKRCQVMATRFFGDR